MTPLRTLVTGAAGFIGSHVVDSLLAEGHTVLGVDNFDPFYDPNLKRENLEAALASPRFRLIEVDCRDLTSMNGLVGPTPIDVLVHLAAKAGVRPSIERASEYASVNVVGTQVMLEFARSRAIPRFVFGSSSSVYGESAKPPFGEDDVVDRPISPYAATKRAGELLCHTFHHLFAMHVIALRFFTVYGPRQRPDLAIRKFATLIRRHEPVPIFGDGSSSRDYTWIHDVVSGVLAAIDRTSMKPAEFQVINLGGSQTTVLTDLVAELGKALNLTPRKITQPAQDGDVRQTCADIRKARRLLGYEPRTSLREGLREFVAWLGQVEPQP